MSYWATEVHVLKIHGPFLNLQQAPHRSYQMGILRGPCYGIALLQKDASISLLRLLLISYQRKRVLCFLITVLGLSIPSWLFSCQPCFVELLALFQTLSST